MIMGGSPAVATPPFIPVVYGQIRCILDTCTDSNVDSILSDLLQFAEYGIEGSIILLQACLDQLNLHDEGVQCSQGRLHVVSAIFRYFLKKPNFTTIFYEALSGLPTGERFPENLSNKLNLLVAERIGIGLALAESENPNIRTIGQSFCLEQIDELLAIPTLDISNDLIQEIVLFLYRSEGLSKHLDSFTRMLSLLKLKESSLFAPLLPVDSCGTNSLRNLDLFLERSDQDFQDILEEIEKEISMADIVKELGYGCTANTSHFKEILSLFLPLNEITLSKLLGVIARTHYGHDDTQNAHSTFCSTILSSSSGDSWVSNSWNIDVLIDSIKQLAPETNWTLVMENLDHEGFYILDEAAFLILMSIYHKACQEPFPLRAICGSTWKNAEGQLSFLRYAVSASPNVFTFAHCLHRLTYSDIGNPSNGHGNRAWYCLDLLEVLCQLAEIGHASSVRLMIEHPLHQCPEVLLVGMSQVKTAYKLIQSEVSSTVFSAVFMDTVGKHFIHHLWHVNSDVVIRGLLDMYHADQNNLARIMETCHELKILPAVLEVTPFSLSIKLAAIASQKEYLNLERWLSENLSTYKDVFLEDCFKFLKDALHEMQDDNPVDSLRTPRLPVFNLSQDICSAFLKVVQEHPEQSASHQLIEEIKKLNFLSGSRPQDASSTVLQAVESVDDVEAEANAYFHQMFYGHLTVEAMIQLLTRFKKSSDRREQKISERIIGNLFEEYKFFPKYPDSQLKLAAVCFGSLIKHHLVTHLNLGMALRCVLDALRKSVDSKMFLFGTTALEQFMDRLIEWPQYCNHILQISHLRGSHSELVSVVEQELARITSSQSESIGGNMLPVDQHQISVPSIEGMEDSSSLQSGQLSPIHLQRHPGSLDDRYKVNVVPVKYTKPLLSSSANSSTISTTGDSLSSQKITGSQNLQGASSQLPASAIAPLSSSSGFLRSSRSIAASGVLRQPAYSTGFGAALNIDTLTNAAERRDTPIESPPSEIQDKISFMINNISAANMDAKANEFTEILKDQYYPWFAQYMVMKRSSIEPNFHDLYLKFLEKVNSKPLNNEIIKATYENCKVLLRSDLIKSSSEERSLLKNLGSWLGKFTIGRNQALRAREIDPKVLIIEAYERGLMIAVIPFTSKVLEPCHCSLAYQPPNPWTMAILGLLVEIYNLPNLKMNLKFDIEVLFKNLAVDMKDVKPTALLEDRVREVEGNPDFSNKDVTAPQPIVVAEINAATMPTLAHVENVNGSYQSGHPGVLSQYANTLNIAPNTRIKDEKACALVVPELVSSAHGVPQVTPPPFPFSLEQLTPLISRFDPYITVNQNLTSLGMHLQFPRIIQMALEAATKDVLPAVIERSVDIASSTTKELVLKDFALESDVKIVASSARKMVARLAGSLAHVTCKEPLRGALTTHLRKFLPTNGGSEVEQIVQIIINDHLDLGCAAIEGVAQVKAVELMERDIESSFASLRDQRDAAGSTFYDAYIQGSFGRVPDTLRPKAGCLSSAQLQVYHDFLRDDSLQGQHLQGSIAPRSGLDGGGAGTVNVAFPRLSGSTSVSHSSGLYSTPQVTLGFSAITTPLNMPSEESEHGSAHHIGVPSAVGADESLHQYRAEVSPGVSSFPVTFNNELQTMESSNSNNETGVTIPSAVTIPTNERLAKVLPELSRREALDKYQLVEQKLAELISKDSRDAEIQLVVSEISDIILRCVQRDEVAVTIAQKVIKSLYENTSNNHIASHLAVLAAIRDVCKLTVKELTHWVILSSDEEHKFNKDITIGLIRSELLNLAEYSGHLAKLMDGGRNKAATEFSISLVHALVIHEPGVSMSEFYNLIEALEKLSLKPGSPESLQQILQIIRNNASNVNSLSGHVVNKDENSRTSREKKILFGRYLLSREECNTGDSFITEHPGFHEQASLLLADWLRVLDLPASSDASYTHFISQMQQNNWLKGDDITDHLFCILTELCVVHCAVPEQSPLLSELHAVQLSQQYFFTVDAYAKLVVTVLKYCSVDQGSNKAALLPKILASVTKVIEKDAEEKKTLFNPRPYFRLFINWFLDIIAPDSVFDHNNFQVLTAFAVAFHALQPLKVPGFSFAWLELVSHRRFMPKLLSMNSSKGWVFFQRLLVALFKFMEPYLRNADLGESVRFLYKGTLRVLLVLLHDFPEFLCEYHFSFCDVIPPTCIQMRNVILSAFPRNMRLPDPSTPNLKIDLLPEILIPARIGSDVDGTLKAKQMKTDVDEYMRTRSEGSPFLTELKQKLLLSPSEASLAGTRYNVPLMNSIVLYVGMLAIQQLQSKPSQNAAMQQLSHSQMDIFFATSAMDIYNFLIQNLDTEGRYLFLNAIANQLRYPNSHTHYFSFVLLYLFVEAKVEIIQEQITRVLIERLIVHRPHPWGLLITFVELVKNPRYNFWSGAFIRCAPEIERIFDSLSRSCSGPKAIDDAMISGGVSDVNH